MKRLMYKGLFKFSAILMAFSIPQFKRTFFGLLCLLACSVTSPLLAAPNELPTVSLSASAVAVAENDLGIATAYAEITGGKPRDVAAKVNEQIAAALAMAREYKSVRTKTAASNTWPVYAKDSRTISGWRMRSSIVLESEDIAALSELVGKLQDTLAVESLTLMPAPATRASAEDDATRQALLAFQSRAQQVAQTLNKKYRIKDLNIGSHGMDMPMPTTRGAALQMASAPVQAGGSDVSVQVNGTIELID